MKWNLLTFLVRSDTWSLRQTNFLQPTWHITLLTSTLARLEDETPLSVKLKDIGFFFPFLKLLPLHIVAFAHERWQQSCTEVVYELQKSSLCLTEWQKKMPAFHEGRMQHSQVEIIEPTKQLCWVSLTREED